MTEQQKEQIRELRESGVSYSNISKETGLSVGSIKMFVYRESSSKRKFCKRCGAPLKMVKGKKEKVFCSTYCRVHYYLHSKKPIYKICPCCGKEFYNLYNPKQIYCSRECFLLSIKGGRTNGQTNGS